MGHVQPPQRKGRVPQYSRNKLKELQQKFNDLEEAGVFARPEDLGIQVEYLNPSFLIKKPSGGHRLVTAFADVGRYSKPQPSLMPNVDSILRQIGQWKYLITCDLTKAFYQIPRSKDSMKYCGVATPIPWHSRLCQVCHGYAWVGNCPGRIDASCPRRPIRGGYCH